MHECLCFKIDQLTQQGRDYLMQIAQVAPDERVRPVDGVAIAQNPLNLVR